MGYGPRGTKRYASSAMTALERGKTLREAPTCDDQVDRGGAADFLLRRVDEAAKHLPVDQLTISPQCGISCDTSLRNCLKTCDGANSSPCSAEQV